jgi:hypothetical protein
MAKNEKWKIENGDENGDVRAQSALHTGAFARINIYAKISQIRCPRDIASCNGPGYRAKRDIY